MNITKKKQSQIYRRVTDVDMGRGKGGQEEGSGLRGTDYHILNRL